MPNPGAFRGSRFDFLSGEKEAYKAGVDGDYASEALALIYRRYFKRYPIDLPHNTEPSAEHLASVDDNLPDPEIEEPDVFALPRDEYNLAMEKVKQRRKEVDFRKGQIKRWMAYQYMKDHHVDPKETGVHNPYRLLLYKLTNTSAVRPRRKTPVNVWRKNQRTAIENEVRKQYGREVGKERLAALRDKVARELFAQLDLETRHEWEVLAKEEYDVAIEQWLKDIDSPPSTQPADRQRAIQGLVTFVQPILDMICDATGWKTTLIAGGPEPAQEGQLNVISIHSGTTSGDVKITFGQSERANIKKNFIPMFGSFLQKCYSPEECRSRSLAAQEGHLRLAQLGLENDNIAIYSISRKKDTEKNSGGIKHGTTETTPPSILSIPTASVPTTLPSAGSVIPVSPGACPEASTDQQSQRPETASAETAVPQTTAGFDRVLEAEADTLSRTTAPPEDEVDMVRSRSPSPVPTPQGSPPPSPPPSRCPSPVPDAEQAITQEAMSISPPTAHPLAIQCVMSSMESANQVSVSDTPAHGNSISVAAVSVPATELPINSNPDAAEICIPDNPGPSARRSTRAVKKTTKLMLMEGTGVPRGRKRKAEALADGKSTVNQEPAAVKRGRIGKKGKQGM